MPIKRALGAGVAVVAATLILSGCKSQDERLSEYRSSGEAFVAQGDYPRAIIQFRNALRIDPDDADTRAAIANAFMAQGELRQAQQEFTLLTERFPRTLEFRSKLGEIALVSANWRDLDRHAEAAVAIDADAFDARALQLASDYRAASQGTDLDLKTALARDAQDLLRDDPANAVLLRVVLGNLTDGDNPAAAIPVLDAALARTPQNAQLQLLRIRLLAENDRVDHAEQRLLELAQLYPDDPQIAGLLVARHMSAGRAEEAEAVLRALADGSPPADTEMRSVLVRFLQKVRGNEAALAELDRLEALAGDTPAATLYAAMNRSIRFDMGDRDGAVAGLVALIEEAGQSRETRVLRVLLARMHDRLANRPEARPQVARVLAEDSGDVGALALRATWAIDEERPKDAITDLRTALAQEPRNTELMTLLAAAHEQNGTRALALEALANAADVSGHSAREAERYALALLSEGRDGIALRVLDIAHEAQPRDLEIIRLLSDLRVARADWPGVALLVAKLRAMETDAAQALRTPLEAALLLGQGRDADAEEAVADMLANGSDGKQAFTRLISGLVARGDLMLARRQLAFARATAPDDADLRLLDADLSRTEGDADRAEADLCALIAAGQLGDAPVLRLFSLLGEQGRRDEADAVLMAGLTAEPGSRALRLIESNRLQVMGDRAGAIALLEQLHDARPDDAIVANNLASMLTEGDADTATLARAARIVAPMQGSMNPAVSDTIGWIAFRRGDAESALPLMERAARGLPRDPQVHLRLGQVQSALGQTERARATYRTVLSLTGEEDASADEARARLSALEG